MAGALRANKYGKLRIVWWCAQLYENYLIRLSNYVSVVSPGMVNPVAELISSERVMKSYNGYENTILKFDEFTLDDEDQAVYQKIIAQINYKEDDKLCLYAGALTQSYDLVTIITAFHRSKVNAKLLILGNGERLDEYKDLVLELGLNNVFFFGFVSRDVVLKICKISSVGLHAFSDDKHWAYVLGNKVFDYIACGLPVLFAGEGTTKELILEARAGLVSAPGDPDRLADKFISILDTDYRIDLEYSLSFIEKNWSRELQTKIFINELNDRNLL